MNEKIIVQCGIKIENEYWFVAGNMNGLFKKSLITDQIDFVGFFPQESKVGFRLYSSMTLIENNIIFIPSHAKEIAIYQIKEKLFKKVPIIDKDRNRVNKYLRCVQYSGSIYFIPFLAETFIKYNVERNEIIALHRWKDICANNDTTEGKNFLIEEICIRDNFIIMFVDEKNQVIMLNMDTDQFSIQELDIPHEEYICSVCNYGFNIWMITNKNCVYWWNFELYKLETNIELKYHMNLPERFVNYAYATSEYIYMINVYHKSIGIFNHKKNEFSMLNMEEYISDKNDNCLSLYYYFDCHEFNDKVYLFSFYDREYVELEDDRVKKVSSKVIFPQTYWQQDFRDEAVGESTLIYLGLSYVDYIRHIRKGEIMKVRRACLQNVGKQIYEEIRRV